MLFHVTFEQAEDGWVVVECPALPGCVSQARMKKRHSKDYDQHVPLARCAFNVHSFSGR